MSQLGSCFQATWHASIRAPDDPVFEPKVPWLGLGVKRHSVAGEDSAEVAFVACSKFAGRTRVLHEVSRLVLDDERWL